MGRLTARASLTGLVLLFMLTEGQVQVLHNRAINMAKDLSIQPELVHRDGDEFVIPWVSDSCVRVKFYGDIIQYDVFMLNCYEEEVIAALVG